MAYFQMKHDIQKRLARETAQCLAERGIKALREGKREEAEKLKKLAEEMMKRANERPHSSR